MNMQDRETSIEKDPQLRQSYSTVQRSMNSFSKWMEAMKDVPSYSEHLEQVRARSMATPNAFKQATGSVTSSVGRSNVFLRATSLGQTHSQVLPNNAIRSASSTRSKSPGEIEKSPLYEYNKTDKQSKMI